ncbi:SPW repeat protein [Prauserella muralis]|uniref:SPW repeat-containing integral membrane domain-containing protein n=1 Tax=Prauserella muralis TaxID=588067 RepID=A0A2V4ANB8_9PSEU|nr:SPW repeat protein [Prauserella muralis]PXY22200.1 hypothetical protein BAY60_20130 [Prauserella muralis]TWE27829.1 SPW repeat-containing protein [Prauserella muralis]
MSPRHRTSHDERPAAEQPQAPMVPEEQYGPWKGMRPPHTHPSAVPADRYRRPSRQVPFRDVLAGFPSALVFLAGVWLLVCPWLIDHPVAAAGFSPAWNDILTGLVVAGLGAVRAVSPFRTAWAGWLAVLAGGWLVAAPFALGFEEPGQVAGATGNDIAAGGFVVALSLAGLALAAFWQRRAARETGTRNSRA